MRPEDATTGTDARYPRREGDIRQHEHEISRNLLAWQRKPLLWRVYRDMHEEIAAELAAVPGMNVEVGSGIGNIKEVIPDCIRSDLFPNPWLDQVENVYALSFADASVSNLILFDVFHHLRYPGSALRELARALVPGGRALIYEPCMGLMGRAAFGLFHHEPIALHDEITWLAPANWNPSEVDYYAAQGNASRIFANAGGTVEGLNVLGVRRFAQLSYVASGGYSWPQLYPDAAYPLARRIDRWLDRAPSIFATRMLVVLGKPIMSA